MWHMFYVLCFMFYVLCFVFYVLCFMFYVLCFMIYVLYFMIYVLCNMFYVFRSQEGEIVHFALRLEYDFESPQIILRGFLRSFKRHTKAAE